MSFIRNDFGNDMPVFNGERFPFIGSDLQTLRNSFVSEIPAIAPGIDATIQLDDGDKLCIARHEINRPAKAVMIAIHGLAGDYDSPYIRHLTNQAMAEDYHVIRVNLRGAGKGRALAKSSYHAGAAGDLYQLVQQLRSDYPDLPLIMAAFSLGGTMAVNLVARHDMTGLLSGLVSFCAPLDMRACAERFHQRRNFIYNRHFTKALVAQARSGPTRYPEKIARLSQARTVRDFDNCLTAPMAGYQDADDYYAGTTPLAFLPNISIPTLLVHSDNDPWIPVSAYQAIPSLKSVFCLITRGGGHVGFHDKHSKKRCWQSAIALHFAYQIT